MQEIGTPVGRVIETWIYPFKGMQGIKQENGISVSSISAAGDRRYAYEIPIVDDEDAEDQEIPDTIPNLLDTIKYRGLLQYKPYFVDPANPKRSPLRVITPYRNDFLARSKELKQQIERRSGRKLQTLSLGRGLYHSMPISLLGLDSAKAIEVWAKKSIDIRAYRQNLLVQMFNQNAFSEDELLQMLLQFGTREKSAILTAVKKDERCATVNFHPESGAIVSGVLKTIRERNNNTLGIYCGIKREGDIKPGDIIYARQV